MRSIEFTIRTKTTRSTDEGGPTSGCNPAGRWQKASGQWCLLLLMALLPGLSWAQCALVCNDDLNISLPGTTDNCELQLTVDMVLEDAASCPNPLTVSIMTLQGLPLSSSPFLNENHIGHSYLYSVQEPGSGNSCWGTLSVEDKLGPDITNCQNVVLPCLGNYLPTIESGNVPTPTFGDCSQIISTSYVDAIANGNCNSPNVSVITRTWTSTDIGGYSSNCTQVITIQRVSLTTSTPACPANVEYQCSALAPSTSPVATGYPKITVGGVPYNVIPGANNFCEIAASYSDEVFSICGGATKILRTWTIYDWCLPTTPGSGNPWSCIQVIKIHDTTAPSVTCPAPIVFSAGSNACQASLTLPPAVITDGCSAYSVKVLTPFGVVTGNGGVLLNVPSGTHQITYVATDACGNVSSCTTTLTIQDNTAPVAVCQVNTTVSLTTDGSAIVSAASFNAGSSDNCGVDHLKVRRMPSDCDDDGSLFDAYVEFTCCDIGEVQMVTMRVFDAAGNKNDCMVQVTVEDKINPSITCPPDLTIECSDSVPPVAVPVYSDNCAGATWSQIETTDLTNCGTGTISRKYKVTDASNRTATCTQLISVINSFPFNALGITWPLDYTTTQCGAELEPGDLPAVNAWPVISEDACDIVAVTHTDQLLSTNPPACYKILRKWIVIDWCQYNPNQSNSPGYWEHVQILKVQDNTPPLLTCPGNVTVGSLDAECGYGTVMIPPIGITDCSTEFNFHTTIDYDSNGTVDVNSTSTGLSGNYPFGAHAFVVDIEDYCGNTSSCAFTVTVVDGKKPTPVCVNGLAVELMADPAGNGGMIQLTPGFFNQNSYDNCTAAQDLDFTITPSFFTCDDVGTNVVTMWVTDEAGNTDYCETYVIIQDNLVICPDALTADVGGQIATAANANMNNVTVNVSGNGPLTSPVTTGQNGYFQFADLGMSYDYTFTPGYNMNPLNGVTTYDLVIITRHILNIQLLDSPYKLIAADVNKSGTVSTADLVELRRLILQIIPTFSNNTSWRFVDQNYVFPNPANPFQPPFPDYANLNDLLIDQANVDFVAVKIGDVNHSATTNLSGGQAEDRAAESTLDFLVDEQQLETGKTYRIPVRARNFINMLGYQFALHFDPATLQLENIEPGSLDNLGEANFGLAGLEHGFITTSWDNSKNTLSDDNTVLFTLVFKAKTNAALSELLQLTPVIIPAEAYRAAGSTEVEVMGIHLQFNQSASAIGRFELYQNHPNPFRNETSIGFNLPEAGAATLTLYDLSGKTLKVLTGQFAQGYNEVVVHKKELGVSGVIFYQLETPSHTATRKMVTF